MNHRTGSLQCLTVVVWSEERACVQLNTQILFIPQENSLAILLSVNIAVNWSDLLLLDWNEYLLYTMPRHQISLALSAVHFTSICKIAGYFFSGADSGSSTMSSCKDEIKAHSHFV